MEERIVYSGKNFTYKIENPSASDITNMFHNMDIRYQSLITYRHSDFGEIGFYSTALHRVWADIYFRDFRTMLIDRENPLSSHEFFLEVANVDIDLCPAIDTLSITYASELIIHFVTYKKFPYSILEHLPKDKQIPDYLIVSSNGE